MDYIKVKDANYLYRDANSKGIVNGDNKSYNEYIQNYKKKYNEIQKMKQFEDDLTNIHSELNEIKTLLKEILNGS